MPKRSSFIKAYSRQSPRTSHVRQTFLASLVEPPFSGKNDSGSVCAQSARSCQPASSASASRRNSSLTVLALSTQLWWRCDVPCCSARTLIPSEVTLVELHACRTPKVKAGSGSDDRLRRVVRAATIGRPTGPAHGGRDGAAG